MSWAGMSGGLLALLEQVRPQHPELPLPRLRDRLVVGPLAHGAARDAEQVRELTISHAQPLSDHSSKFYQIEPEPFPARI